MKDTIKLTALVGILFASWFVLAATHAVRQAVVSDDDNTTLFVGS